MLSNIYKRKDGRYEARIALGKDSMGKRLYRSFYGKSPDEAEMKLLSAGGQHYAITEITVREITTEYLATMKPRLKESTYANYKMKAEKHIIPALGEKRCCFLRTNDITDFIGSKTRSGLSARYVADILVLLKSIFRFAARTYNIRNPLDGIKLPKCAKTEVAVLNKDEQSRLLRHISRTDDPYSLGIVIALYTGMRIGEICALKWEDVDLAGKVIHVRHTLQRIQTFSSGKKTKIVITEPKSASSVRDIPIPDCLLTLLTKHHAGDNMFVLSGKRKPVECRTLQYRFAGILNNANLPSVHFHSLRHAFATNCISLGFDVKTLSEILGHSSVEITLNRYVHSSIERKRACMSLLTWVA
ncbi:site-specific integrase [Ruminococcus sp.]|uniref:tyrosine-type recombinase/integrase n=1 Tax=Ruminococcus sp. TaxID=41978 RepID=UPI0025E1F97B|nr:site-specific integrase [Ruminococcus sp.]MBR1433072.1 site-specific integrase [Ruminococcus sp.]